MKIKWCQSRMVLNLRDVIKKQPIGHEIHGRTRKKIKALQEIFPCSSVDFVAINIYFYLFLYGKMFN